MALAIADRVKETTTTSGTGTLDLAGAVDGFQTFVAGIGDGNTCHYGVVDGNNWEIGVGTVTDAATDTLSRDTVIASSNGGSKITLSGSEAEVFVTFPGDQQKAREALNVGNIDKGHIRGLKLTWVSATAIDIETGAAYIESSGSILESTSVISLSSLSLTANTWYYAYLYDNAGTPDVELVTDAPAAPYFGTARSKSTDNTRRFIGCIQTDGSGNVINNFYGLDGNSQRIEFSDPSINQRFLNGGSATSFTSASFSSLVPSSVSVNKIALVVVCQTSNAANQSRLRLPGSAGIYQRNVGNASSGQDIIANTELSVNGGTSVEYNNTSADGSTVLDLAMITIFR